jgi:hypothetical protein
MFMKLMHLSGLSALLLAAGLAHAAPEKRNVDIQSMMVEQCAAQAAAQKVTDIKTARKVCTCTIGVQASNLKLGEFWEIQSAALSNRDPSSIPALVRIKPQLDKCRAGVNLNLSGTGAAPAAAPAKK